MSKYRYIKAEGQEDKSSCWAASLSWWLRARYNWEKEQYVLIEKYSSLWNNGGDGTINRQGILSIVQDTSWGMRWQIVASASQLTKEILSAHLENGPVYIAYEDQNVGKHVNVIYDLSGNSHPQVSVMEPGYKRLSDGTYKGKHLRRSLSYYTAVGEVILASRQWN